MRLSHFKEIPYPNAGRTRVSRLFLAALTCILVLSGCPLHAQAPPTEWVIYSTQVGWLRVGPRAEFNDTWKLSDEIWGSLSDQPLQKTLITGGFGTRDEAVDHLCSNLTKVYVWYSPRDQPHEVVKAIYEGKEYYLRLERGNDPEVILHRAEEYDFDAEKRLLAKHGITPRIGFGKRWLIHATGHGTVDGGVRDDRWMLFTSEPWRDPDNPATGRFIMPDGNGGTVGYSCDRWEGPYRDNYGLVKAMKRLTIPELEMWPPGNSFTQKFVASDVPDDPTDHGPAVPGVQPIVDPGELRDWVIYSVGDRWLHVGTRAEFESPVKARDVIWGGDSDQNVPKQLLSEGQRLYAYDQAVRFLCQHLTNPRVEFHPAAPPPNETVNTDFGGKSYIIQVMRDPDALTTGYSSYNLGVELDVMRAHGLAPHKLFGKQWLVHATGHGTSNGGVKDDRWMMVKSEPHNGGVTIPDGDGGTFGYSVDAAEGPFEDSGALARALKIHNLKSMGLAGEDRGVSVDDATPPRNPDPDQPPRVIKITPDTAEAGQTLYVTVIAEGMKSWWRLRFGAGVTVSNETYLGKNPDGEGERWLATISVADGGTFGSGQ